MKVVISGYAWLDVKELSETQRSNLRRSLTVYPRKTTDIASKEEPKPIELYKEDHKRGLLGVPREFYRKHRKEENTEVLRVSYGEPMSDEMLKGSNYRSDGPYVEQESVIRKFIGITEANDYGGFILNAGCAWGKTICAIEFARRLGRRTLIIVHKEFLVNQWINRINGICPSARVGIIQQNKCQYKNRDFVVSMVHSLAKKDKYPKEVFDAFNLVITDEVHMVSAYSFSPVLPMFSAAWKLGLSATPARNDGAEPVFFEHIGEIAYSAKSVSPIPQVRRLYTDSKLKPINRGRYKVSVDKLNSAQVVSQLADDKYRSRQIVEDVIQAVVIGKKVMIVSERLKHLKDMASDLSIMLSKHKLPFVPVIDFHTGEWFTHERYLDTKRGKKGNILHRKGDLKRVKRKQEELTKAERANVIMATLQQCREALDISSLDILVLATPVSDPEQIVGRVRRWCMPDGDRKKCKHLCPWRWETCEGKPQPMVLEVIDENVKLSINRWKRQRLPFYRKIGAI